MAFEIQLYKYNSPVENDTTNLNNIIAFLPEPSEYLSHIWRRIGHQEDDYEEAVSRAQRILKALHIPVELNIRKIFRSYDGHTILKDYKISRLATYLIVMNANPSSELTAGFQFHVLQQLFHIAR